MASTSEGRAPIASPQHVPAATSHPADRTRCMEAHRSASATLASLILAGGAGSLYVAQSAYWTLSANIGGKSAGAVSGIMNMGAQIGGVVTASSTAIIASAYGWTVSFLAAAIVCLVGGLLWFLIDPDHLLQRHETAVRADGVQFQHQ